jgi:hypothetical protein
MTDEPTQAPPPPAAAPPAAPPTLPNFVEASAKLASLTADQAWRDRVLSGADPAATAEFHKLTSVVAAGGSDAEIAMSGALPDLPDSQLKTMADTAEMLRNMGFPPLAIRETLAGKEATPADVAIATAWKNQHMRSPEFVKQYLSGEPDAVRQMMVADIILSSNIRSERVL